MGRGYRVNRSSDAVAEVVATVALVAVAVMIAALVSSFTFGLAFGAPQTVAIAVRAEQQGDEIVLTCTGGEDMPALARLDVTGTCADGTGFGGSFPGTPPSAGDVLRLPGAGSQGRDHVVVAAGFVDGSRHPVLDAYV